MRVTASAILVLTVGLTPGCAICDFFNEMNEDARVYDDIAGVSLAARPSYTDLLEAQRVPSWYEFLTKTHVGQQRRAVVFNNGIVRVDGPQGQEWRQFDPDLVRGIGWSNDGTRLALVERRDLADKQHALYICDDSLNVMTTYEFEAPTLNLLDRYVVSWSADDKLIAVSTSLYAPNPTPLIYLSSRARLVITNVEDGQQTTHDISDAYFVGERQLLFTSPPEDETTTPTSGRVHSATYSDDGSLVDVASLPDVEFVVGSSALHGAFLVVSYVEECFPLAGCSDFEWVELRNLDGEVERPLRGGPNGAYGGEGTVVIQAE